MQLLDKSGTIDRKEEIISAIKAGKIFIYPTDTIYGLGCEATNEESVRKIREIKKRDQKPFSVIGPSKKWIRENCLVTDESKLNLIPGPYTLILKLINTGVVSGSVSEGKTLGVRIPDNWFSDIVANAGVPFVTTSVNVSGEKHMEKLDDVPKEVLDKVDYCVYDGPIFGKQSNRVDLTH